MTWDKLIELIMKLVEMCFAEGETEEAVKDRLVNPRWRDWRRVRVHIRREMGFYGKTLRQVMADIHIEHADATYAERVTFASETVAAARQRVEEPH